MSASKRRHLYSTPKTKHATTLWGRGSGEVVPGAAHGAFCRHEGPQNSEGGDRPTWRCGKGLGPRQRRGVFRFSTFGTTTCLFRPPNGVWLPRSGVPCVCGLYAVCIASTPINVPDCGVCLGTFPCPIQVRCEEWWSNAPSWANQQRGG